MDQLFNYRSKVWKSVMIRTFYYEARIICPQHLANSAARKIRDRAIYGQTGEQYLFRFHFYEYRWRFFEYAVNRLAWKQIY